MARRAVSDPCWAEQAVPCCTLGVPTFQEQVMQLQINVAAGPSAGEGDREPCRAMAARKRKGGLEPFQRRLIDGMRERGYPRASRSRYSPR